MNRYARETQANRLLDEWREMIDPDFKLGRLELLKWFVIAIMNSCKVSGQDARWRESKRYEKARSGLNTAIIEIATAENELTGRIDK